MRFNTLKNFIVGLSGGILGVFLFLLIVFSYPDNKLGAYILSQFNINDSQSIENQKLAPTILPSLAPDFWESLSDNASLSSVAVQVFKENRLIKSGTGIILSSDGLIIIPADLTYSGGIYQILYEDKIMKGFVVLFDMQKNLAIIKIMSSEPNLNVSDLNVNFEYQSGQDVLITGKLSDFSKPVTVSQRGIVSYISGNRIVLDTFANTLLLGAKVLNSRGELIGMLYIRGGKSYVISSKDIDNFFKEYLKQTPQ
ncbi:MAG: hypothetical protein A3C61_01420 [Candidatus Yanofskybacteria bacterium RIFCSPHIGHO2_02_FULL_39_10]|uniref:Serine protease n=1 Tax=Candidatus Yanofskybacteria bacterium RIFCSPHIGHO2_02_FULL_39_10 TaxID=1802674 RepID=A0A1F8F9T5_9BACT|nr:MAG: hypothetical protein A3C61_01420 [Candidatus Yanofskybacteria bacterium RIFCSPHIGHO2_02_FULL_39_10]